MASTIKPNHEAQMRPLALCVTSNHRLAFRGGEYHEDLTWASEQAEGPINFPNLNLANKYRRDAIGATDALLARIFNRREAA